MSNESQARPRRSLSQGGDGDGQSVRAHKRAGAVQRSMRRPNCANRFPIRRRNTKRARRFMCALRAEKGPQLVDTEDAFYDEKATSATSRRAGKGHRSGAMTTREVRLRGGGCCERFIFVVNVDSAFFASHARCARRLMSFRPPGRGAPPLLHPQPRPHSQSPAIGKSCSSERAGTTLALGSHRSLLACASPAYAHSA